MKTMGEGWELMDELIAADPNARYGRTFLSVSWVVQSVRRALRPVRRAARARTSASRRSTTATARGRAPDDPPALPALTRGRGERVEVLATRGAL